MGLETIWDRIHILNMETGFILEMNNTFKCCCRSSCVRSFHPSVAVQTLKFDRKRFQNFYIRKYTSVWTFVKILQLDELNKNNSTFDNVDDCVARLTFTFEDLKFRHQCHVLVVVDPTSGAELQPQTPEGFIV